MRPITELQLDTPYIASSQRYQTMQYRRCGKSGLFLPLLSLGLWHNFGETTPMQTQRALCRTAFDLGITHFDLANNYGPPYGEAERNFGQILQRDLAPYRDELVISTKAGWDCWPGPYGDNGSRKYIIASCERSLRSLGLDYVDIFYHHRPDPETPLEETVAALDHLVRQGKALYIGISQYSAEQAARAAALFQQMGTPFIIHQPRYNLLERWIEEGLLTVLDECGTGCIVFSPLAQGVLTGKYSRGIPADSRASQDPRYLNEQRLATFPLEKVAQLQKIAEERGQTLAQMALAWVLHTPGITSALIGASRPQQLAENVAALQNLDFTQEETSLIDSICGF